MTEVAARVLALLCELPAGSAAQRAAAYKQLDAAVALLASLCGQALVGTGPLPADAARQLADDCAAEAPGLGALALRAVGGLGACGLLSALPGMVCLTRCISLLICQWDVQTCGWPCHAPGRCHFFAAMPRDACAASCG